MAQKLINYKDYYDPKTGFDMDFYSKLAAVGGFYKNRFIPGKICCKEYARVATSSLKKYADYLKSRGLPKKRFQGALGHVDHSKESRLNKIIGDFSTFSEEEIENRNIYEFVGKLSKVFPKIFALN